MMENPKEFEGFTAMWCVGGPLDGRGFADMPVFASGPAAKASIPYGPKRALRATYLRREVPEPDGRWLYDFVPTAHGLIQDLPPGTSVSPALTTWSDRPPRAIGA